MKLTYIKATFYSVEKKLPLMLSETNLPFCQNFKYDRLDGPGSETENLSSTIPLSYTLAFYLIMVKAMYK